ncbi:MAG: hypothetical protein ICV67_00360 [Thermoleophilia bacterium]|nr:hypothetical protein [Thermoleophilia bacterium]
MAVLTFVSATIAPEHRDEVIRPFTEGVAAGLPPGLRQTFLLVGEDDTVAVASVWERREDLDAMLASGEEPFARRVLREAGGEPEARVFDIAVERG